jgi:hypothetical protein
MKKNQNMPVWLKGNSFWLRIIAWFAVAGERRSCAVSHAEKKSVINRI